MCGRFSQFSPVSDLVTLFDVDESLVDPTAHRPRFNVAPSQQALVIASTAEGTVRKLGAMRWGLVPSWAKDLRIGNRMINARAERVTTSNAYRAAFAKRRCLVPADGFYEWAAPDPDAPIPPGGKQAPKRPFHIHATDGTPLALAGLWEVWRDAEDTPIRTFTILTTDANERLSQVHDRMPVILQRGDWDRWLAPEPLDEAERERLLVPAPGDGFTLDEVSTLVNRPANDTPELIEPVHA